MRGLINFFLLNGSLGARLMVSASAGCWLLAARVLDHCAVVADSTSI